jgi:hypothetical protein
MVVKHDGIPCCVTRIACKNTTRRVEVRRIANVAFCVPRPCRQRLLYLIPLALTKASYQLMDWRRACLYLSMELKDKSISPASIKKRAEDREHENTSERGLMKTAIIFHLRQGSVQPSRSAELGSHQDVREVRLNYKTTALDVQRA